MNSNKNKNKSPPAFERIRRRKVVTVDKLEVGMFVCKLDRPWDETPFVFQGFLLRSAEDIAVVSRYCEWVYIDVAKFLHFVGKQAEAKADKLKYLAYSTVTLNNWSSGSSLLGGIGDRLRRPVGGRKKSASFMESLKPAIQTHRHTGKLVKSMMDGIAGGKSIDVQDAKEAIAACADCVADNKDAMLLLTRLRHKEAYTAEHSLNVAVTSMAFAQHAGLNAIQIQQIGLCGLLHDMGKILTPGEVLNKPGQLSDEEMAIMRRHPEDGREILLAAKGVVDEVVDVAYAHHERLNGSGYPRGISNEKLSLYTRMVGIADVFDAITNDRVYSSGKTAEEALSIIHQGAEDAFDASLIIKFIGTIGTYPLGTIVEAHNGEIGIVVANNPTHRLRPKIKLLLDAEKQPRCGERFIDLGRAERDSQGQRYMIRKSHKFGSFDIDLTQHVASYAQR